jgi:hypothetical protein
MPDGWGGYGSSSHCDLVVGQTRGRDARTEDGCVGGSRFACWRMPYRNARVAWCARRDFVAQIGGWFSGPRTGSCWDRCQKDGRRATLSKDIPVGALLVQDTITALLATDGVAALERDFGIAVTAQVLDAAVGVLEGVLVGDLEASVVAGLLLRHGCGCV